MPFDTSLFPSQFMMLAGYYRKFIPNFARIARPLHQLTYKGTQFTWSPECQGVFEELKERLITPPVLAYPDFKRDFVLETDASVHGIGAVLAQYQDDGNLHPVSYASRALSASEKNYGITELETPAVVWAVSHYHHFLYGNVVTVYTDHTAVKAVLETPNPTGKHARWWTKVYGRGVKEVWIIYRAGKENKNADALSCSSVTPAPQVGIAEEEVQVSPVCAEPRDTDTDTRTLFPAKGSGISHGACYNSSHLCSSKNVYVDSNIRAVCDISMVEDQEPFAIEQRKDPNVKEIIDFLEHGVLPENNNRARKIALQESLYAVIKKILYFIDPKHKNQKRAVVPKHLQQQFWLLWRTFFGSTPVQHIGGSLVVGRNVQRCPEVRKVLSRMCPCDGKWES